MQNLFRIILLATFFISTGASAAGDHGTAEEAVAMVQKAIVYLKANGLEKTIAEVHNSQGQFRDRDLYISIGDLTGKNLANGANPKLAGKNLIDLKDADGKAFVKERMDILKAKDKGWQNYKWPNPLTKQIESKSMYFEKVGDVIISCGIYK